MAYVEVNNWHVPCTVRNLYRVLRAHNLPAVRALYGARRLTQLSTLFSPDIEFMARTLNVAAMSEYTFRAIAKHSKA